MAKLSDADLARLYPSMVPKAVPANASLAERMYPNSPSMWPSAPPPPPLLPERELRHYPASPAMWADQVAARAAGLKALAAQGDQAAAKDLADLPGAVVAALASNPQSTDSLPALDLVAGLMEPNR